MSVGAINQLREREGVVWRPCMQCGLTWPFPTGIKLDGGQIMPRDWQCVVCAAEQVTQIAKRLATLQRALDVVEE